MHDIYMFEANIGWIKGLTARSGHRLGQRQGNRRIGDAATAP
jgi:hypothetical protein